MSNATTSRLFKGKSCGFFIFRPDWSFLVLKGPGGRYDVPKGRQEAGEIEYQTALRELYEETGIREKQITVDPSVRFEKVNYRQQNRRGRAVTVKRTIVLFLAHLKTMHTEITLSEHCSFNWYPWSHLPVPMQRGWVDDVRQAAFAHLSK